MKPSSAPRSLPHVRISRSAGARQSGGFMLPPSECLATMDSIPHLILEIAGVAGYGDRALAADNPAHRKRLEALRAEWGSDAELGPATFRDALTIPGAVGLFLGTMTLAAILMGLRLAAMPDQPRSVVLSYVLVTSLLGVCGFRALRHARESSGDAHSTGRSPVAVRHRHPTLLYHGARSATRRAAHRGGGRGLQPGRVRGLRQR